MKRILLSLLIGLMCQGVYAEKIKVACIGDSITYGTGLENREVENYPAQLQKLLGEEYLVRKFGNPGRGIYLHSMRGEEYRGFRYTKEHQEAVAWSPDIVICNLGINDCGEYLHTELETPGQFEQDYKMLLSDYCKSDSSPKFYLWGKLSTLAPGQKFYRSPEPFLMQEDIKKVAAEFNAELIDMASPMQDLLLTEFPDKIHPSAIGALQIARTTFEVLMRPKEEKVALPTEIVADCETWLCAGQSNMLWRLNQTPEYEEELKKIEKLSIWIWEFRKAKWENLTRENAGQYSAIAVEFAIRRAEVIKKPIALLQVAAGGAPAESFLSEATMAAIDNEGKALYPSLLKIVTNRKVLNLNEDFPCKWCAREYPKRRDKSEDAPWWPVSKLYDEAISKIKHLPITGVLWYQGESNATTNIGVDLPLNRKYMKETVLAAITELRPTAEVPFLVFGLPKLNRPWGPYRLVQKEACNEKGAIYLDTFGAGLGDRYDVHPKSKISFVDMAIGTLTKIGF